MKTKLKPTSPNDIELTLEVTMSLGSWKKLKEQVDSQSSPSWDLRHKISDLVSYAEKHFYIEDDE